MDNSNVISISENTHIHSSVTVNDLPGDFYESTVEDESNILFWFDETSGLVFRINSPLNRDTILSLAEGVASAEAP